VANSAENPTDLDDTDTVWLAADKLRGTVDAAEYKHVVRVPLNCLGRIFQLQSAPGVSANTTILTKGFTAGPSR
jgi:hypothetical protein